MMEIVFGIALLALFVFNLVLFGTLVQIKYKYMQSEKLLVAEWEKVRKASEAVEVRTVIGKIKVARRVLARSIRIAKIEMKRKEE